jgi:chromate transport protein ChrA
LVPINGEGKNHQTISGLWVAAWAACLPLFSISQKTLYTLLLIGTGFAAWRGQSLKAKSEPLKLWAAWMIPNLGFLLLASRNAFNDLQSGLITGQGELLTSLSRAWLYLLVPMLLVWFCRIGILGLETAARSVATGLMGKIWICLALTPVFSDRFASKGHILQFPTLEPNVTQWVGNYAVITAACLAIAIFNPAKNPISARLNRLLCILGLITFLYCSVVLNNLGCTIGSGLCIGLIAADLARQRQHHLRDVRKQPKTQSLQHPVRLIGFAGLGAALAFAVSNQALLEALRVKHLLIRNDRLEFLAQGFKRFAETPASISYLTSGPPSFQRPICFSANEAIFTDGNSCHSYWHNIAWDAFRNSGYIGLTIGLVIVSTLLYGLIRSLQLKAIGASAGFLASFYVVLTSPIIETGAGEVLPLALLIAMAFCQTEAVGQWRRESASMRA